jgi:hypothetical protein
MSASRLDTLQVSSIAILAPGYRARESNRESQTARKPACTPGFLAKSITCSGQIIAIDQSLPHSSRTTIYSALDDCRRLIAAGKVQRWDVVKWGVTVNVALATAAAVIEFNVAFSSISFGIAVLVAFVSWQLVSHYNVRVTGARNTSIRLVVQMKGKGIDYNSITDTNVASDYSNGLDYDKEELRRFKRVFARQRSMIS